MNSNSTIWPNFFFVGAPKCGTSSFYFHLKKHPDIFLPSNKEPQYFITPHVKESVSLDEYDRLYRNARGYIAIGDMSPSYLRDEHAPKRIFEVSPNAKIIAVIRDPVVRAHSDFNFARSLGIEPLLDFRDALQRYNHRDSKDWYLSSFYVDQGMYYAQIRRYIETFGRDRVLVVLFDDLTRNPQKLFAQIAEHIGVDPAFFANADLSESRNEYRMPKQRALVDFVRKLHLQRLLPSSVLKWSRQFFFDTKKRGLDDQSRHLLQEMYDPDVARLEQLLERKLPELRKSWV
jgi:hypothetical protein